MGKVGLVENKESSRERLSVLPLPFTIFISVYVSLGVPLDRISEFEREILTGQPRISIHLAQAMRPEDVIAVLLFIASEKTREAAVEGLQIQSDWRMLGCYGFSSTVGKVIAVPQVNYHPPQTGQSPASKVLTRHSLSVSLVLGT